MKILEHNVETGIAEERDATKEEIIEIKNYAATSEAKEKQLENDKNAKQSILDRLGLTLAEAALLLK